MKNGSFNETKSLFPRQWFLKKFSNISFVMELITLLNDKNRSIVRFQMSTKIFCAFILLSKLDGSVNYLDLHRTNENCCPDV